MQQSHHLIHHQGTKSKKPYATVPLCHCATASVLFSLPLYRET